jgi:hypothetical protein
MVKLMVCLFSQSDYGRASTMVSWGSSFGTIIIYLLAPVVIMVSGWKPLFLITAGFGAVMAFVWLRFCEEPTFEKPVAVKTNVADKKNAFVSDKFGMVLIPSKFIGDTRAYTDYSSAGGNSSADQGGASGTSEVSGAAAPKEVTDSRLPKVSAKTMTAVKRSMTVSWAKLPAAKRKKITGIEVQYSLRKSFPAKKSLTRVRTVKKTAKSVKIKKLRSKKTYWVRMRTFRKVNGVKHAGKWSKAKKIQIK